MKSHILTACVAAAVGALANAYLAPRPTRIEYRDRLRTVTVRETARTKQRTVHKPDGTVITERTDTATHTDTDRRSSAERITTTAPRRWHAGVLLIAQPRLAPLGADLYAGAMISRQLFGPVSLGLTATVPVARPLSVPALGLTLGVTF